MYTEELDYEYAQTHFHVDRVLGFSSSLPNWNPPTPSPPGQCVPSPFGSGGGGILACSEWGSQFGCSLLSVRGGILYGVLWCDKRATLRGVSHKLKNKNDNSHKSRLKSPISFRRIFWLILFKQQIENAMCIPVTFL